MIKQIFTWWHSQTIGTFLYTIFFGKLVGRDESGNKYYENRKKSGGNDSKLYRIIHEYDTNFKKHKDKYKEKKGRYRIKNKLIRRLKEINLSEIKHPSLRLIVKIFQQNWSFSKKDFMISRKRGNKVIEILMEKLIQDMVDIIKKQTRSISLDKNINIRDRVIKDVKKLVSIEI